MKSSRNIIQKIKAGSIAQDLGIGLGDELISINQKKVLDIIDYMYLMADDYVEVEIKSASGDLFLYEIEKDPSEDLGIEFSNSLIDRARTCSNKCIFCFIDQMPQGMRPSLYFKDDDSRLSFLQGNFVTLTNMSEEEIQRIIDYRISPINVSVHTTNPQLRIRMLKNKKAGQALEILKRFDEAGLEINCQIVLVPGINDKEELDRTLKDLFELENSIRSVAIVPVGLTRYREGLEKIQPFDEVSSLDAIRQVEALQKVFMEKRNTRFAFMSDEFYLLAGLDLPDEPAYEGYPQIENGVGMVRSFYEEVVRALERTPKDLRSGEATIVTGTLAFKLMVQIRNLVLQKMPNLDLKVRPIVNDFFGHTITVAGLITGCDIINQMEGIDTSHILIPDDMLRQGTDYFLDGLTISDLEAALGLSVSPALVDGQEFIDLLTGEVLG